MKQSEYYLLLAAIWLAPYKPDVINGVIAAVMIVVSMYYFYKKQ